MVDNMNVSRIAETSWKKWKPDIVLSILQDGSMSSIVYWCHLNLFECCHQHCFYTDLKDTKVTLSWTSMFLTQLNNICWCCDRKIPNVIGWLFSKKDYHLPTTLFLWDSAFGWCGNWTLLKRCKDVLKKTLVSWVKNKSKW